MNREKIINKLNEYYARSEMEKAEDLLMEGIRLAVGEGDSASMIVLLNELIGLLRDTAQYTKGLPFCATLEKAVRVCGLEKSIQGATSCLNIANFYRAAGDFEKSHDFYKKTEKIYFSTDTDEMLISSYYNNLALLYQEEENYEAAAKVLEKAVEINLRHEDEVYKTAVSYANLSATYLRMGETEQAENYARKALEIFERDEEKDFHYSSALSAMGDVAMKKGRFIEAASYYEKAAADYHKRTGATDGWLRLLANLDAAYRAEGREDMLSGTRLARDYFTEYGREISEKYGDFCAFGLAGEGSDCYGTDDEVSRDHDFGAGFCIWLSDEKYEEYYEEIKAAYAALPEYFRGFPKLYLRRGVMGVSDFAMKLCGCPSAPETLKDWLHLSENEVGAAAFVNGEIYEDRGDVISSFRKKIAAYYPDRVRYSLLAQYLAEAAQEGQYNYPRAMMRGDIFTARLHINAFVEKIIKTVFVLNKKYLPHRKQAGTVFGSLPVLGNIKNDLEELMQGVPLTENWEDFRSFGRVNNNDYIAGKIEDICGRIAEELRAEKLTECEDGYLETYAKEVWNMAEKDNIINKIISIEWKMFDKVKNKGGRADCQDNFNTFEIMRKAQYLAWNTDLLERWLSELEEAERLGRNLIMEKYARMMKYSHPEEYEEIKSSLPETDEELEKIVCQIAAVQTSWMEDFSRKYPEMAKNARTVHSEEDTEYATSYETYLRGELLTYSPQLILMYGRFIASLAGEERNLTEIIMENTALLYGYKSLEDAEKRLEEG